MLILKENYDYAAQFSMFTQHNFFFRPYRVESSNFCAIMERASAGRENAANQSSRDQENGLLPKSAYNPNSNHLYSIELTAKTRYLLFQLINFTVSLQIFTHFVPKKL